MYYDGITNTVEQGIICATTGICEKIKKFRHKEYTGTLLRGHESLKSIVVWNLGKAVLTNEVSKLRSALRSVLSKQYFHTASSIA